MVILIGNDRSDTARWVSVAISVLIFVMSLSLYTGFDSTTHLMQFVEKTSWISQFDINYHIGVDGISMPLIILTTFSTCLGVDCRLGSHSKENGALHGGVLNDGRLDYWCVLITRCDSFLRFLGSVFDSNAIDYRYLGWR